MEPDAVLARRVADGDRHAFSQLYDRYARAVYALAAHALGRSDAEEVVQDVFMRLWRKASQYDPERGSFAAWFMTITRRRVIDELARRGHAAGASAAIAGVIEEIADAAPPVDEEAARSQLVLTALRALPAEQRRALALAYFGGLTQSEIAAATGWPLGTVKKRMRLGLQKLRAALAPQAEREANVL